MNSRQPLHLLARHAGLALALLVGLWACPAHADYDSDPFDPVIARNAWLLIAKTEREYDIPAGLLHAISLVESGQGIHGWVLPWPYTVGVNGSGARGFTSRQQALGHFHIMRLMGYVRFTINAPGVHRSKLTPTQAQAALNALPDVSVGTIEAANFGRRFNSEAEAEAFVKREFALGNTNLDIGMMQINWRVHGSHFRSVAQALDPVTNLHYAVSYLLEHHKGADWWSSVGRYHSGTSYYANRYIRNVYAMYLRIHRVTRS